MQKGLKRIKILTITDASGDPPVPEKLETPHMSVSLHGGCGSSSLRECVELLNNAKRNAPATLHSGVKKEVLSDPRQVMSPNEEKEKTTANAQASSSMSSSAPSVKEEHFFLPTLDAKIEVSEPDLKEQNSDALCEEAQEGQGEIPLHDSEDSLGPERIADELRRLTEAQAQSASATPHHGSEEGATAPNSNWTREGATAPDTTWDWENRGPYAPQRSGRHRGRLQPPDPNMFRSTIWVNHDQEASARAHDSPVDQLRDRGYAMEHNLETLTRLTQVADLRDAQGIRDDHRALVARLTEVEERASAHTLREFMSKILR